MTDGRLPQTACAGSARRGPPRSRVMQPSVGWRTTGAEVRRARAPAACCASHTSTRPSAIVAVPAAITAGTSNRWQPTAMATATAQSPRSRRTADAGQVRALEAGRGVGAAGALERDRVRGATGEDHPGATRHPWPGRPIPDRAEGHHRLRQAHRSAGHRWARKPVRHRAREGSNPARGRRPSTGVWVLGTQGLSLEAVRELYAKHHQGDDFDSAFTSHFEGDLPESINTDHHLVVVASGIDTSSEQIVDYLRGYRVPINVLFFEYLQDGFFLR